MKIGDLDLIDLLKRVPNQFKDFMPGMIASIRFYQIGDEVKQFLLDHPDTTTDDVLNYVDELIDYN